MSVLLAAPTLAARSVNGIRIDEVLSLSSFGALHTSGGFRGTRVGAEELLLWRTGPKMQKKSPVNLYTFPVDCIDAFLRRDHWISGFDSEGAIEPTCRTHIELASTRAR